MGLDSERDSFDRSISAIEASIEARRSTVSNARHLPRLLSHGHTTDVAVLYIHGLYESPQYGQGVAQALHEAGMNVFSVLLPGHWAKRPEELDATSRLEWVAEVQTALEKAQGLGRKIVVGGFSTGGLLAVNAALDNPSKVAGLMLLAPAMYVSQTDYWASVIGSYSGLTLHDLQPTTVPPPDGYDHAFYSAKAGLEVTRLIRDVEKKYARPLSITAAARRNDIAQKLKLPVFFAMTDEDKTVPAAQALQFYKAISGTKMLVAFHRGEGIRHGTLAKSQRDTFAGWETYFNPQFERTVGEMTAFARRMSETDSNQW